MTLAEPNLAGGSTWWIEGRAAEGGRQVVVRDGTDAITQEFSARTRVHEYGGGAYAVHGNRLAFSNDDDGRVYMVEDGGAPEPVTPEPARPRSLRYADFWFAPDGESIYCVRESHEVEGEPANEIVRLAGGTVDVIATGHDFYSAPRTSPDGRHLSFLSWDHPRMPWDGTELWVADAAGGGAEQVTGGPKEAIVGPSWSPGGVLHWASDRSGWWNLYRDGEPLHPAEAEFAMPMWVFGQTPYAFLEDGRIACGWTSRGFPHLGLLDPATGALDELQPELLPVFRALAIQTDGRRLAYVGASPTRAPAVVVLDPESGQVDVLAKADPDEPDPAYLSEPRAIDYDSHGRTAHALFYSPRNAEFDGPEDERPPLIVISHGGPTAQTEPVFSAAVQYWTTRGFAVVDVNYGGSTGYGRAYRELLRGQWGVVDLEDCAQAALHLAEEGESDDKRLVIRGGSAGGYTTLCALVFTETFHAGANYFGVADLESFAHETHKFESRYDQALVPVEKRHERSPINFVDRISAPLITFQGLEDAIVPPSQSELIVRALEERGVEHEYHAYEGEAHGFRKAETIVDSLQSELAFYGRVLGFDPA